MNTRKTFVFYTEWKELIQNYPAELKLELYEAIVDYAMGNNVELSPIAQYIFPFIRVKIDADINKYEVVAERNRVNGAKGGRKSKKTQTNPKNPNGLTKTQTNPKNLDNDNDNDNELISPIVDINEKEKKENNNIIFQKKEKTFDSVFDFYKAELLSNNHVMWREIVERKFGVKNHALALDEFKAHIIAQGKESNVTEQNISEFKAYFANSVRIGFLSDKTRSEPKSELEQPQKRKPCKFYTQRTGQGVIGVIIQDCKTYHVPMEVGSPPTESHFWNPESKQYEI